MRSRAEEAVTVSVYCKSGMHQRLICANMAEARRVWNAVLDAINAFLPYAVVEDSTSSSVMLVTAEIASISFGVTGELLRNVGHWTRCRNYVLNPSLSGRVPERNS